jgi:hypothetical protein
MGMDDVDEFHVFCRMFEQSVSMPETSGASVTFLQVHAVDGD